VTTAIGHLVDSGLLRRLDHGAFLLIGEPSAEIAGPRATAIAVG
jgi:hypothetical protein